MSRVEKVLLSVGFALATAASFYAMINILYSIEQNTIVGVAGLTDQSIAGTTLFATNSVSEQPKTQFQYFKSHKDLLKSINLTNLQPAFE